MMYKNAAVFEGDFSSSTGRLLKLNYSKSLLIMKKGSESSHRYFKNAEITKTAVNDVQPLQ